MFLPNWTQNPRTEHVAAKALDAHARIPNWVDPTMRNAPTSAPTSAHASDVTRPQAERVKVRSDIIHEPAISEMAACSITRADWDEG